MLGRLVVLGLEYAVPAFKMAIGNAVRYVLVAFTSLGYNNLKRKHPLWFMVSEFSLPSYSILFLRLW